VERALDDLGALRMRRVDKDAVAHGGDGIEEMVPAAGIPWFVSLFGRDALVVSLQTLSLSPGLAAGSLQALAALQGDRYDDRHDLQPGKIEHEFRHGELAHFELVPQTPYYGTHDATTLYVWAAAELWRWTANRTLIEQLRPHVERALHWIDVDGDSDGDGLQEYETRAGDWGYYNQGWKDSGDGVVNADGSNAELPIATCELQGYVVAAKRGWADTLEQAFDDAPGAAQLRRQADRLAEAIEERFWWEAEGAYYLGLDGRKRPIESVASNQGHLLWAHAITGDRAARVVTRLLEADMWSGWGVRTLSAAHVATRCPTSSARSGPTTTRSSRTASPATDTARRPARSPAHCSMPPDASSTGDFPRSMAVLRATKARSRFSTSAPTSRKPGPRARSSTSSAPSSALNPTPQTSA
jgi:glycogen debranching enzyme